MTKTLRTKHSMLHGLNKEAEELVRDLGKMLSESPHWDNEKKTWKKRTKPTIK